ncbi:hypothetical protein [Treponema primitia]|uniref:hypothetical protein n=1 Tax=Treponema primitia TaxID=88058 RepID=UPI0009DB5F49|nr:hypothetical protein [Treponema primitia]
MGIEADVRRFGDDGPGMRRTRRRHRVKVAVCGRPGGKDGGRWCPEKRSAGGSHRLRQALGGAELPHAV